MKLKRPLIFLGLVFLILLTAEQARAESIKIHRIFSEIKLTPAIVLFYKQDCAPCQLEVNMLPRIIEAAGDWPVTIVSLSKPDRKLQNMDVNIIDASKLDTKEILSGLNNSKAVLPFSLALDKNREICGTRRGMLGTDLIKSWQLKCRK